MIIPFIILAPPGCKDGFRYNRPVMKKKKNVSGRLRYPEDEQKQSWLPLLLDALWVVDRGIAEQVMTEERRRGMRLACARGCDVCCRSQTDIPVYPLEMAGIYWYVIEKLEEPLRSELKQQLAAFRNETACPFLFDRACSIHPLRPIGCRLLNVFGTPCAEGEDPYFTRREDVLSIDPKITERAWMIMLPFYGYVKDDVKREVIRQALMHGHAQVLQTLNWKELAERMDDYDRQKKK